MLVLAILVGACGGSPPAPASAALGSSLPSEPSALGSSLPSEPIPSGEPLAGLAPTGPTEKATVVRVVDGDTIVVDRGRGDEKLRYIGVDTPETVKPGSPIEWMGPEASAANKALVAGREVLLEKDVSETDRYGRLLRYVWLRQDAGWLLVNLELVRRGFAAVVTYPPDVKYVDLYLVAQREARDAGRGLWGSPSPASGEPMPSGSGGAACDPSYPSVCIPPPPPDLDCGDIPYRRFNVLPPDPHHFDGDRDGIGCES